MIEIYLRRGFLIVVFYIIIILNVGAIPYISGIIAFWSMDGCNVSGWMFQSSINTYNINSIDRSGYEKTGLIYFCAGQVFPGFRNATITGFRRNYVITSFQPMQKKVNGLFLTDQPVQPFNQETGNTTATDLPPP